MRRMQEPGVGDACNEREPRCPRGSFGREIELQLGVRQRSDAPEQVELEPRYARPCDVTGVYARVARSCGSHCSVGVDLRKLARPLDVIALAGTGDIGGRRHQVAIVGECLQDQRLQPRIPENVRVADGRKGSFGSAEVGVPDRPGGGHRHFRANVRWLK